MVTDVPRTGPTAAVRVASSRIPAGDTAHIAGGLNGTQVVVWREQTGSGTRILASARVGGFWATPGASRWTGPRAVSITGPVSEPVVVASPTGRVAVARVQRGRVIVRGVDAATGRMGRAVTLPGRASCRLPGVAFANTSRLAASAVCGRTIVVSEFALPPR